MRPGAVNLVGGVGVSLNTSTKLNVNSKGKACAHKLIYGHSYVLVCRSYTSASASRSCVATQPVARL